MPTKLVSIRIDTELLAYLQDRAEKEHRSLSNIIIAILMEEMEQDNGRS